MEGPGFEVWIDSPTQIIPEMFMLWLKGASETEAVAQVDDYRTFPRAVLQEIYDQYHVFSSLEKYLHNPPMLFQSVSNSLPTRTRRWLVNKYYEYDASFMKEVIGKNLSRVRKDLDQVAERCGVSLKSCRRQFANLRRIVKAAEDSKGPLLSLINTSFLIDDLLAKQYARIVFICYNRFVIDKRRLTVLSLDEFLFAAEQLMTHWILKSQGPLAASTDDVELDDTFLSDLHQLRNEFTSDVLEAQRCRIRARVGGTHQAKVDAVVRTTIKALLQIGAELSTKDLQNLFVDIMDKIVVPCRERGLTREDMGALLDGLLACTTEPGPASAPCFLRLLKGISPIILHWFR